MNESHNSGINQLFNRYMQPGAIKGWLKEHWLTLMIIILFVTIVLCMINLIVMVLTT